VSARYGLWRTQLVERLGQGRGIGDTDQELDAAAPVSLNAEGPLTTQFFIEDQGLRHSFHHLPIMRAALKRRRAQLIEQAMLPILVRVTPLGSFRSAGHLCNSNIDGTNSALTYADRSPMASTSACRL
jgi:hypothetical protein